MMKKLILLTGIGLVSSFAFEAPTKRVLTFPDESNESQSDEANIQVLTPTSPSKPGFMSPEKATPRGKRSRVAGADEGHSTERLSDVDRQMEKVPGIMSIKNEFNYPIMLMYPSFPRTTTKALFPGEQENLKGLKLSRSDSIMIHANNRNHVFEYNGNKFMHYINKTVTGSPEINASKVAIIVDSSGDIHIKPFSE